MKQVCKGVFIFISIFIVCLLLKVCIYALPFNNVENNILRSYDKIAERGNYVFMPVNTGSEDKIDYWTESGYIQAAFLIDSEKPLDSAMANTTSTSKDSDVRGGGMRLKALLDNNNITEVTNPQYWWGAMVFLRPMLNWFTYEQAISIWQIILGVIFALAISVTAQKLGKRYALALVAGVLMVSYSTMSMLLHTSMIFALSFVGIILALNIKSKDKLIYLMVVIGTLTAYFDWMSTPIIAFAYPMMFGLLYLYKNGILSKFIEGFICLFKSAVAWAFSYFAMLMSKWMLSSIVLKQNVVYAAMERAKDDVSKSASDVPEGFINYVYQSMKRNWLRVEGFNSLKEQDAIRLTLVIALVIIILIVLFIAKKSDRNYSIFLILLTSMAPVAWTIVFRGHVYVHFWFTYRNFSVFITGIIIAIITIFETIRVRNIFGRIEYEKSSE